MANSKPEQGSHHLENMIIRTLKPGTVCRDSATQLEGTITHWLCDMGRRIDYIFQPKGLNDEGEPLSYIKMEVERLVVTDDMFEEVDVPIEILGTLVTDKPSGFTGMAVGFIRHVNGCFHVYIQPKGILQKTKMPVKKLDFDLRQCSGKKIPKMNAKKLAASKEESPSPAGSSFSSRSSVIL
ncbi:MAG: hypothetical protein WCQ00_02390 [bacterium]